MAVNTLAFEVFQSFFPDTMGEDPVIWLMGRGTPDGDREPFKSANKGSFYSQLDATDDNAHVWQKIDEGGDDADWKLQLVAGLAQIVNADIAAGAGIVGSKLATNARRQIFVSDEFNIDNGSGTTIDFLMPIVSDGLTIIAAHIMYTEATDSAGVAAGNAKIGTTVGAADIVAATAYQVSKAAGGKTAMTLVSGDTPIAANGTVFVRHTGVATTDAGKAKVVVEYLIDD